MNIFRNVISSGLRFPTRNVHVRSSSSHVIDPDAKTTVNIMNKDSDYGLMINSYSNCGFRLNNGLFILGPMAIFPKSALGWNVKDHTDIDEDCLSLFFILEPKLDILILGCGDRGNAISTRIIPYIRSRKIAVEVLGTVDACATFNFLNAEKRCVAAAMLPPTNIATTGSDAFMIGNRQMQLQATEGWLNKCDPSNDDLQGSEFEIPKSIFKKKMKMIREQQAKNARKSNDDSHKPKEK